MTTGTRRSAGRVSITLRSAWGPPVELPITGELDLHAFALRDVASVVEEYVSACRERGIVHLRLVHGRGKGVQRAVVQRLLKRRAGVRSFRDAPPGAGVDAAIKVLG